MISAYASGTQSASLATEHFLSSPNEAASYILKVDLSNMAAGDVVELRVYEMVLTGGTARVSEHVRYDGVQPTDNLIAKSVPISTHLAESNAIRFSLKQTKGTGRDFPWSVSKLA